MKIAMNRLLRTGGSYSWLQDYGKETPSRRSDITRHIGDVTCLSSSMSTTASSRFLVVTM